MISTLVALLPNTYRRMLDPRNPLSPCQRSTSSRQLVNNHRYILGRRADHDTAQFATNSIRRWWKQIGSQRFPGATTLLVTADGGGSSSPRSRLWRVSLQNLADALELKVTILHFPPGTSRWNKIEHRPFSFITSAVALQSVTRPSSA